jgi:hypothetical protein
MGSPSSQGNQTTADDRFLAIWNSTLTVFKWPVSDRQFRQLRPHKQD